MPGYVVVITPDQSGIPQGKTYFLGDDVKLLAVVALLEAPPQRQVQVIVDGLHVRTGPGEEYPVISDLRLEEICPVFELKKDYFNNEWVRIAAGEWICRLYNGHEKAIWLNQTTT